MGTMSNHSARPSVYLDHNATTPVAPDVFERMRPWLTEQWGNPSSAHAAGQRARLAVETAREQVAALIGASTDEVVFTSGGTESNNWVLFGAVPPSASVVVSAMEHPTVSEAVEVLEREGRNCRRLPIGVDGRVDLGAARDYVPGDCGLCSVMLAHNETGIVQPVAEIARLVRSLAPSVVVHTDAAQAVGKILVDVRALGVDLLTIAGHKFGAPKGIGALYVRAGIELRPLFCGGGQQGGRRPGTEPVAQIVGLGAAAELARHELATGHARQLELRERLWQGLAQSIPGLWRAADAAVPTLPNTLFVCFPHVAGAQLLQAAPSIAASTGSACHAGDGRAAGVLTLMGVDASRRIGAVRLTLGRTTTGEDIDIAVAELVAAWRRLTT